MANKLINIEVRKPKVGKSVLVIFEDYDKEIIQHIARIKEIRTTQDSESKYESIAWECPCCLEEIHYKAISWQPLQRLPKAKQ